MFLARYRCLNICRTGANQKWTMNRFSILLFCFNHFLSLSFSVSRISLSVQEENEKKYISNSLIDQQFFFNLGFVVIAGTGNNVWFHLFHNFLLLLIAYSAILELIFHNSLRRYFLIIRIIIYLVWFDLKNIFGYLLVLFLCGNDHI